MGKWKEVLQAVKGYGQSWSILEKLKVHDRLLKSLKYHLSAIQLGIKYFFLMLVPVVFFQFFVYSFMPKHSIFSDYFFIQLYLEADLLGPIFEELLCRGCLYNLFRDIFEKTALKKYSVFLAIFISSIGFGLLHVKSSDPLRPFLITLSGMVFGYDRS